MVKGFFGGHTRPRHLYHTRLTAQSTAPGASRDRAAQRFQFLERPRPILAQQAGKSAVGEQLSAGLAFWAVVRLVGGVPDALHLAAAAWTGLAVFPMHCHGFAERSDVFRKAATRFGAKPRQPFLEG